MNLNFGFQLLSSRLDFKTLKGAFVKFWGDVREIELKSCVVSSIAAIAVLVPRFLISWWHHSQDEYE